MAIETAMTAMKEDQTATKTKTEDIQQRIDEQFQQHVQQTKQGFDYLAGENHSLQQTVADAMAKRETKLTQSFEELKYLFLQIRGTKRPSDNIDQGPDVGMESDVE